MTPEKELSEFEGADRPLYLEELARCLKLFHKHKIDVGYSIDTVPLYLEEEDE